MVSFSDDLCYYLFGDIVVVCISLAVTVLFRVVCLFCWDCCVLVLGMFDFTCWLLTELIWF